jgi:long-chain fatty acid transport protein
VGFDGRIEMNAMPADRGTTGRWRCCFVVEFLLLAASLTIVERAQASPELPLRFGARSLAMGGTGVAFVDDATAAAVNPAGLDRIEHFSISLGVSPFLPRTDVPFSPGRNQSTEREVVPLFFAGGGVRLFDPLTAGIAFYVASGVGAHYTDLPEFNGLDMKLELAVLEAALPVSYRLTDELSVGVALRFAHAMLNADQPIDVGGAVGPLRVETNLTGNAFPGVLAGVMYRPTNTLAFGATYRSKMTIPLEGDGTATYPFFGGPLHVESEYSTAHAFRLGGAWSAVPERLLLALDLSYTLLDEAVNTLPLTVDFLDPRFADTHIDRQEQLQWKNSFAVLVGGEYSLSENWAARLGYHATISGTREEYADPRVPPPGVIQTVNAGGGFRTMTFRADLGAAYAFAGGADVSETANGPPGEYGGDYWLFGASVTYQR